MIALDYRLEYFPMTYFIDKSGRVFAEVISASTPMKSQKPSAP